MIKGVKVYQMKIDLYNIQNIDLCLKNTLYKASTLNVFKSLNGT